MPQGSSAHTCMHVNTRPFTPPTCPAHNNGADSLNRERLRALHHHSHVYDAVDTGEKIFIDNLKKHAQAPGRLELKVGAQVILLKVRASVNVSVSGVGQNDARVQAGVQVLL